MRTTLRFILLLVATSTPFGVLHADTVSDRIKAAMAAPERPAAGRERDRNRRPVETLAFLQLQPTDRVLELIPGGGWYTRLLAAAVRGDGELNIAFGTTRVEERLLTQPEFSHIKVVPMTMERDRVGGFLDISNLQMDAADMDLVLTFRNLHNLTAGGRAEMNAAAFRALKPGGRYGVVDHTARHMEPATSENRRRLDPVLVIKEVEAAGFEFVDFSNLHYRPDDELRYEVGRRSVTGNTDRFTLLFRRPTE